jgi:heptaprenyl diphosphate synthase
VIILYTTEREIRQLKDLIDDKLRQTVLVEHIKHPVIDEYKLLFLDYLFKTTSLAQNTKEKLLVSVMLVQIALDIHEDIPNDEDIPVFGVDHQLAILAGDYYSGLYYHLLSEIEEHEFITLLATAIKHINELKMKVFFLQDESPEEYMELLKQIHTRLIYYVAEYVQVETEVPVIEEFLFMTHLLNKPIIRLNQVEMQNFLELQIQKTKGMIDDLPEESNVLKMTLSQLFETTLYQNTAWEKE